MIDAAVEFVAAGAPRITIPASRVGGTAGGGEEEVWGRYPRRHFTGLGDTLRPLLTPGLPISLLDEAYVVDGWSSKGLAFPS